MNDPPSRARPPLPALNKSPSGAPRVIGSGVAREARGAKILGSVKLNRIAVAVPRPEPRLRARLAVRDSSPEIEIGSEVELGPEFEAALGDELFLDL